MIASYMVQVAAPLQYCSIDMISNVLIISNYKFRNLSTVCCFLTNTLNFKSCDWTRYDKNIGHRSQPKCIQQCECQFYLLSFLTFWLACMLYKMLSSKIFNTFFIWFFTNMSKNSYHFSNYKNLCELSNYCQI